MPGREDRRLRVHRGGGERMLRKIRGWPLGLRVTAVGFVIMALMMTGITILARDVTSLVDTVEAQDQSQVVSRETEYLITDVVDMETSWRGYVITGREEFLQPFYQGRANLPVVLAQIRTGLKNQPDQLAHLTSAEQLISEWVNQVAEPDIAQRRRGASASLLASADLGKSLMDQVRQQLTAIQDAEQLHIDDISRQEAARASRARAETWLVGLMTLAAALLLGIPLTRNVTRPVHALVAATRALAEHGPGIQIPVRGDDEIGRLTAAFNGMSRDLADQRGRVVAQTEELQAQQEELAAQNEELVTQQQELTGLVEQLQVERSRLQQLIAFSDSVSPGADLRQLATQVLAGVLAAGRAQVGALILARHDQPAQILASAGLTKEALGTGQAALEGLAGRAIEERHTVAASYPSGQLLRPVYHTRLPVQHELYVPLVYGSETVAVAVIGRTDAVGFDSETRQTLELMALQAAAAFSNRLSFEQLAAAYGNLDAILRSTSDGIRLIDEAGQTIIVNERFWELLNSEPEAPMPAEALAAAARALNSAEPMNTETISLAGPIPRVLQQFSAPAFSQQGQNVGRVFVLRDVTRETELDRMKNEFVSTVSHELRTPLTSIRGALGVLAGGLLGVMPEKAQRMLDIAVNNTDRLVRLINDILDIERMESGKVTMEKKVCDAGDLMQQAGDSVQGVADRAGVKLSVSPLEVRLWVDPDRIIQTMTNLLGNAVKFSPQASTVWLTAEREGDQVRFRVKDQGRGIPADKLEAIFQPFKQVDASDAREKGGTGLGLAICQRIVEQHGGRIWAESTFGEGSTFIFALPALRDDPAELVAGNAAGVGGEASDRRGKTVLVCDDDGSILAVVKALLEQRGYRVLTAASGQDALQQAASQQPDAVLLDLIMPGMSGWETMEQLKADPATREIPVVIFSALSTTDAASNRPQDAQ